MYLLIKVMLIITLPLRISIRYDTLLLAQADCNRLTVTVCVTVADCGAVCVVLE